VVTRPYEPPADGFVAVDPFDRLAQQGRHAERRELGQLIVLQPLDGVGKDQAVDRRRLQTLDEAAD
jgi:hypothetical protein